MFPPIRLYLQGSNSHESNNIITFSFMVSAPRQSRTNLMPYTAECNRQEADQAVPLSQPVPIEPACPRIDQEHQRNAYSQGAEGQTHVFDVLEVLGPLYKAGDPVRLLIYAQDQKAHARSIKPGDPRSQTILIKYAFCRTKELRHGPILI